MTARHCRECGRPCRLIYARSSAHGRRDDRTGLPRRVWVRACPQAIEWTHSWTLEERTWHSVFGPWFSIRPSGARRRVEERVRAGDRAEINR